MGSVPDRFTGRFLELSRIGYSPGGAWRRVAADRDVTRDAGRDGGSVTPMPDAERARRYRERKKAEGRGRGPGKPFEAGHQLSVRHGAYSERMRGPVAEQLASDLLADPEAPEYLRQPRWRYALRAWSYAEADLLLLQARRDELIRQEGPDEPLVEETDLEESESRPAMGSLSRVSRQRQRESLQRALDRADSKARGLRADLGLSPAAAGRLGRDLMNAGKLDLAVFWAEEAAREAAEGG